MGAEQGWAPERGEATRRCRARLGSDPGRVTPARPLLLTLWVLLTKPVENALGRLPDLYSWVFYLSSHNQHVAGE